MLLDHHAAQTIGDLECAFIVSLILFCFVLPILCLPSIYYSYLCVCSADQGRRIGRVGKGAGGGAGPPPMGGG